MRRFALFFISAFIALGWSAQALWVHWVRLDNQAILNAIRQNKELHDKHALKDALTAYSSVSNIISCNAALQSDLALLYAYHADAAMVTTDGDAALEAMQKHLLARLACNPHDGKSWLDLAMVDIVRQGVTARAITAYRMSALASPSESWLAKKRLEFALALLPLLGEKERRITHADLIVLERAHPNNMLAVQTAAQAESKEALYAVFGVKVADEDL